MKKSFLLLALIGLISSYSFAQKVVFEEYNLDNGMHVILHRDTTTPIVAVSIMYHVGSKNEDPERTGFAHFFEHLMFEGSANIGRGEYMKTIQGAGGELNANTSFDRTYYYEIVPSNQLELALWMESERLLQLKVDSIGVETQRAVVKEERRMRYDNRPYGRVGEEIFKRAYNVHPYRWMPIGSTQYIDQATLGEFMDFYKTFYVPNNAVLSISGDFNPKQAKEWIGKYFGDIAKGTKEIPRPKVVEPQWKQEKRDSVYDKIQLPMVAFCYHIPEQTHPDYYAIQMLMSALSGGESARLTKQVVNKDQKAVQAYAYAQDMEDPGLAMIQAIANLGVAPKDLEKSIDAVLEKVINEAISDEEMEALRNQMENSFVSMKGSNASIAENLAQYYTYYNGKTDLINSELEMYMRVTKEDIQRVAKQYLKKENRLVLYVLPKK